MIPIQRGHVYAIVEQAQADVTQAREAHDSIVFAGAVDR